jgi:hypothetical protein
VHVKITKAQGAYKSNIKKQKIMTTTSLTSLNRKSFRRYYGSKRSYNTYNVTVECEDNEYYEFEVDADSYGEACAIAETRAMEMYVDIIYITVEQAA